MEGTGRYISVSIIVYGNAFHVSIDWVWGCVENSVVTPFVGALSHSNKPHVNRRSTGIRWYLLHDAASVCGSRGTLACSKWVEGVHT